ncbi:opsin [Elysia marginata]|uniref:Opsin n=1 Tax=Elysia marginata TaxID=1093978 RepID=A0AAV4JQ95_9GAST|nr:opsin [Elysia marginata]
MNWSVTSTRSHAHWRERGVVSPWIHLTVGVFVSLLGLFSVCGNVLVVWTCTRFKDLRTRSNILIINLAIGDLLMCCIDFPLMAAASFLHTWPYGQVVCQLYAWITAVAGLVTINTLAAIAVDRYWAVVRRATPEQRLSKRVTSMVVLVVWAYSIMWALCPILGWGDYVLDGIGTTCTFDYLTRTWWNRSFVIAMATGNFLLPFSLMVFCYTRIWAAVREVKRGLETDFSQTTKGGSIASASGGKDRRPSFLSTGGGSTANKDSGVSGFSGCSNNSTRMSRTYGVSTNTVSCDGKDMKVLFSCSRFVCQHRLENQSKITSSGVSGSAELCLEDANFTNYDENRNKSPSTSVGPNFPKISSSRSGRGFSVYFQRRPEIVVTLGRRRHSCRHYLNCGPGYEVEKISHCRQACLCERRSKSQNTVSYTRGIEQASQTGGCRFAFKSYRMVNGGGVSAREGREAETRNGRYGQDADYPRYRALPRHALRSFHNCCSSCCHRQNTGSPRCPRLNDNEESMVSQSRNSTELNYSGEHRCRGSSASSTERSRAKIKQRHHRLNCEHKTLRIILFLLLAFTFAWCPYLAVSLVGLFGDQTKISYLTSVLPSLVAKTSIVTNPILYSISHPKVRKRILTSILCPSHLSKPTYHVRMRTNQSSYGVSNSQ